MNAALKSALAVVAQRTGVMNVLRRGAPTNVVFALHRVLPAEQHAYNPNVCLRLDTFAELLRQLSKEFDIVSLATFVERLQARKASRLAALTFDDGWIDTYQYAFPVLRDLRLTTTTFLPTALIGTNARLPEERLARLWDAASDANSTAELLREVERASNASVRSFDALRTVCKRLPFAVRSEILASQERRLGVLPGDRAFMNWEEVRAMQRADFTFGTHTRNHVVLNAEDEDIVECELRGSREDILRETRADAEFIAYPNGGYDARTIAACERTGYRAAFTTHNAFVDRLDRRFEIPRVAIDDTVLSNAAGAFSAARTSFYLAQAARAARSAA